jgi:thiol-disulfide isomerase/thioredoxin
MKKSILVFLAVSICAVNMCFADNSPAPDFTLTDLSGNKVTLSSQKGKVVFLDFWASWCPPCRASIPEVEKLYEKFGGQNVAVFGVNVENDPEAAREFVQKKGIKYPVLLGDDKVSRAYEIRGIPAFYIIDQGGNIAEHYIGFERSLGDKWADKINVLLSTGLRQTSKNQTKKK